MIRVYGNSLGVDCSLIRKLTQQTLADLIPNADVSVSIIFKDMDKHYGLCYYRTNRPYRVFLSRNLSLRQTLLTLFHELAHVKQFVRGELAEFIQGRHRLYRWKQKEFYLETKNSPWEKDANRIMYRYWRKYNGKRG